MYNNKKIVSLALSSLLTTTASLGASAIVFNQNESLSFLNEEASGVISSMSPIGQTVDGVEITEVIDLEQKERSDGLIDLVDPNSGDVWFVLDTHESNTNTQDVKSAQRYSTNLGPRSRYTISGQYIVGIGSSFSMDGTASNDASLSPGMLNRLTGQYTNFGTWTKSFAITATITAQTPGAANTFTMSPTVVNNSSISTSLSGMYNVIR